MVTTANCVNGKLFGPLFYSVLLLNAVISDMSCKSSRVYDVPGFVSCICSSLSLSNRWELMTRSKQRVNEFDLGRVAGWGGFGICLLLVFFSAITPPPLSPTPPFSPPRPPDLAWQGSRTQCVGQDLDRLLFLFPLPVPGPLFGCPVCFKQ